MQNLKEPNERQKAEEQLRLVWVQKTFQIIKEARLHLSKYVEEAQGAEGLASTCTGSKRARTIRQHCRKWLKVRSWLVEVVGIPFPTKLVHLTDYIDHTLPGCPPTHPRSTAAALHFMETAGAVPNAERLSDNPIWTRVIDSAAAKANTGKDERKQAPSMITNMLLSLELYVQNEGHSRYKRLLAWTRLLKIWACMRSDDIQGIVLAKLGMKMGHLEGRLERTKTSGPSRSVAWLPFVVDKKAKLTDKGWLNQGYDILTMPEFGWDRDFLIPRPTQDLESCIKKMATESDLASYFCSILAELKVPVFRDGEWHEGGDQLVPTPGHLFWTGHSERNFAPAIANLKEVSKEDIDRMGRWRVKESTTGSDDYNRSHRILVRRAQLRIVETLKSKTWHQSLRELEQEVLEPYVKFLTERGVDQEEAEERADRLKRDPPNTTEETPTEKWDDEGFSFGGQEDEDIACPQILANEPDDTPAIEAPTSSCKQPEIKYWVGVTFYTRRLHKFGCCPYADRAKNAELVEKLSAASYNCICKHCFKERSPSEDVSSEGESSSSEETQN